MASYCLILLHKIVVHKISDHDDLQMGVVQSLVVPLSLSVTHTDGCRGYT